MRFKTKDLMINVMPQGRRADVGGDMCLYPTHEDPGRRPAEWICQPTPPVFDCHPTVPDYCLMPTPQCAWYTPCGRTLIPCAHGTGIPCGFTPGPCGGTVIDDWTLRVRQATPALTGQPGLLEQLKTDLAATQKMLEEVEIEQDPIADVERVEAGLVEALEQVRAQRKDLVRKSRKGRKAKKG